MQKLKFLAPALPLTVICVVIAFILSTVNAFTADKITDNILREKEEAIRTIFPEADSFTSADASLFADSVKDAGTVVDKDGNVLGYYADVSPVGFKGEISLIAGCDLEGKVIKVSCLSTSETPAVGTRATESVYLDKFASLGESDISGVDTLTGATISSKAVRLGIKHATETVSNIIEEGK